MRRGLATLMVLGCLALATAAASSEEAWKRFVHPSQGFSLSYPAEWELVPRPSALAVAVIGPEIAEAGGMRLSVNVASESLPREVSIAEYEAITESKVALILNGYQRLRTDRTAVGGRPAILRYYTWKRNDGIGIYQMQLYTIARRRAYVVTATTSTNSPMLEQDATLLRRIILTFKPAI